MRYSIVALSALAAGAMAGPIETLSGFRITGALPQIEKRQSTEVMTDDEAQRVAENFKDLINLDFNKTLARTAMTKGFTDYSDSVIELINSGCTGPQPLTEATFTSRKAFIAGQSSQPPIPFEILQLWNAGTSVHLRWRSSAPGTVQPEQPVTGIIAIEVKKNNHKPTPIEPWLIDVVYSEFNSGAWLVDLGVFVPTCDANGNGPPPPSLSTEAAVVASASATASATASAAARVRMF